MKNKKILTTLLLSLLVVILLTIFTGCNAIKSDLLLPQLMVLRKALASIGLADNGINAPTFSPAAGTYTSTQSVSISTTTTGAILCYTTDGSTPSCDSSPTCASGTLYSSPVSISTTTTLKALACKAGNQYSAVGTGIYTLNGAVDTPVISNLRDKGIVNTGFMIGTAGTNTSSVEVSLDNGSYSPATGTTSWKFQFPTGSSTWRDNSQHTVSVRTKNSLGNTSSFVSITVRKGSNQDINGDGYEDAFIDGASYNAGQGRVYIFYSTGNGGITQTLAASADRIITGEAGVGNFGFGISTGDINGDGYADLSVGANNYNAVQGRTYIFYSTGISGIAVTNAGAADTIITGESGTSGFGIGVATGDINGDGYADLVIGASSYNTNWGRSYIFYSPGAGAITTTLAASADKIIDAEGASAFGIYITIGDVNGDGYADLVIGASSYNTNRGRSYIFYSTGAGGITQTLAASADRIITGQAINSNFSQGLALGDVNGDGFLDLMIGGPIFNTLQGRTYIFYSTGAGGITQTLATSADRIITGGTIGDKFGNSAIAADVNGDGYTDLIVTAVSYNGTQGRAYIFYSTGSGGITTTSAAFADKIITGEFGSSKFGFGSLLLDMNGDGFKDIIIGAISYSGTQGRAYIFYSAGNGGVTQTLAASADKIITGEAASQFGRWRN